MVHKLIGSTKHMVFKLNLLSFWTGDDAGRLASRMTSMADPLMLCRTRGPGVFRSPETGPVGT